MEVDKKIKSYIDLRNRRSEIKKIYSEGDKQLKDEMGKLEMEILEFLDWTGQKSAKTEFGTAYKQHSMSVTVKDSEAFFNYVLDNKAIDLLERRINKSAYKLYKEDGIDVPGIDVYIEAKITVRKS